MVASDTEAWRSLKYQTQHGPEATDFPFYPAALEFANAAKEVLAVSPQDQRDLVAEWKRTPRFVDLSTHDEILARYATVVLDQVVDRARVAAARTENW